MLEALCRQSSATLDILHADDGPPITQRTSGLVGWLDAPVCSPALAYGALAFPPQLTAYPKDDSRCYSAAIASMLG